MNTPGGVMETATMNIKPEDVGRRVRYRGGHTGRITQVGGGWFGRHVETMFDEPRDSQRGVSVRHDGLYEPGAVNIDDVVGFTDDLISRAPAAESDWKVEAAGSAFIDPKKPHKLQQPPASPGEVRIADPEASDVVLERLAYELAAVSWNRHLNAPPHDGTRMNSHGLKSLLDDNLQWLEQQKHSLERMHLIVLVKQYLRLLEDFRMAEDCIGSRTSQSGATKESKARAALAQSTPAPSDARSEGDCPIDCPGCFGCTLPQPSPAAVIDGPLVDGPGKYRTREYDMTGDPLDLVNVAGECPDEPMYLGSRFSWVGLYRGCPGKWTTHGDYHDSRASHLNITGRYVEPLKLLEAADKAAMHLSLAATDIRRELARGVDRWVGVPEVLEEAADNLKRAIAVSKVNAEAERQVG